MLPLNRFCLTENDRQRFEAVRHSPMTVLQVGEGNFLRGFVDWMIHQCRIKGLYEGSIAVTQPRPSGKAHIETLAEQDGLYTLVTRGIAGGEQVERKEIVSVFSNVLDPYSEWNAFLELAGNPDLQFVVSNTTEAGIAYRPEALVEGKPIESFPGKMALFLFKRYVAFGGDPERGLIFLPCELVEQNGWRLRDCVIRYCEDWRLPPECIEWIRLHNRFLNTLVDRIVTGYPAEQADTWFSQWGYTDKLLNTAEPYCFWAIEAEPEMDRMLPLRQAGLDVVWTADLKPYQQRKVRILNGAHTLMTPLGILYGLEQVREVMEHAAFGPYVREAVGKEIIPALPLPEDELHAYANSVFERFANPYIRHRLSDIALNSISKFKTRLLPTLSAYADAGRPLPSRIVRSLAGLLRYCRTTRGEAGYTGAALNGARYIVRDDPKLLDALATAWEGTASDGAAMAHTAERLLRLTEVWDSDLSAINGLVEAVGMHLLEWEEAR